MLGRVMRFVERVFCEKHDPRALVKCCGHNSIPGELLVALLVAVALFGWAVLWLDEAFDMIYVVFGLVVW